MRARLACMAASSMSARDSASAAYTVGRELDGIRMMFSFCWLLLSTASRMAMPAASAAHRTCTATSTIQDSGEDLEDLEDLEDDEDDDEEDDEDEEDEAGDNAGERGDLPWVAGDENRACSGLCASPARGEDAL